MKLLRVSGSNNRSIINTNLNHPLSIEPYSKIALESVSFEVVQNQFIVDANNNKISYQNENNVSRSILLTEDIYDKTNYNTLLNDIEDKLNSSLGINDYPNPDQQQFYDIGAQFKVSIDRTAKTNIEIDKNKNFDYINNTSGLIKSNNVSFTNNTLNSTLTADTEGFTSFVNIDSDIVKGCGFHMIRINTAPSAGSFGFIMALVENRNISNNPINSYSELNNYIWVKNTSGNENVVYKDVSMIDSVKTTINFNAGSPDLKNRDYVGFLVEKGKIKFISYNYASGTGKHSYNEFHSCNIDRNKTYSPVIIIQSKNTNVKLDSVRLNLNPYKIDKVNHYDGELGANNVPYTQGRNTNKYLEFDNIDLANYLGYDYARYPEVGTYNDKLHIYEAENPFRDEILSDNYLIELLTFDIESYISNEKTGEKMNILCNIPRGDETGGIYYNPNNLIWIDLNNKESILLRNFNFRLLDEYLDNVITKNNITLTLLFKNENE